MWLAQDSNRRIGTLLRSMCCWNPTHISRSFFSFFLFGSYVFSSYRVELLRTWCRVTYLVRCRPATIPQIPICYPSPSWLCASGIFSSGGVPDGAGARCDSLVVYEHKKRQTAMNHFIKNLNIVWKINPLLKMPMTIGYEHSLSRYPNI